MSTTLISDLYTPTVALEYARQAFSTSLELMGNAMGPGQEAPIQLVNPGDLTNGGVYLDSPVYTRISSLVTKRDRTSVAGITGLKLAGVNEKGVLMSKKVGHVEYTPDAEFLSKARPGDISREVGLQAGEAAAAQIQSSVINALIGALAAMTTTAHTSTIWAAGARTNLTPSALVGALQLMGDFQSKIKHWLMRSEGSTDLFSDAIGRGYQGVGDQALQGDRSRNTLGRGFSVVDDAILTVADAGFDKYITIGLGQMSVRVMIVRPLFFYEEVQYVNTEQVTRHIRADFDFLIQIPGFEYDSATAGANPTDTVLSTSTSWLPRYTSAKEVPIVNIIHNYSGN